MCFRILRRHVLHQFISNVSCLITSCTLTLYFPIKTHACTNFARTKVIFHWYPHVIVGCLKFEKYKLMISLYWMATILSRCIRYKYIERFDIESINNIILSVVALFDWIEMFQITCIRRDPDIKYVKM